MALHRYGLYSNRVDPVDLCRCGPIQPWPYIVMVLYSYGQYNYGPRTYGLYSHGLYSYVRFDPLYMSLWPYIAYFIHLKLQHKRALLL